MKCRVENCYQKRDALSTQFFTLLLAMSSNPGALSFATILVTSAGEVGSKSSVMRLYTLRYTCLTNRRSAGSFSLHCFFRLPAKDLALAAIVYTMPALVAIGEMWVLRRFSALVKRHSDGFSGKGYFSKRYRSRDHSSCLNSVKATLTLLCKCCQQRLVRFLSCIRALYGWNWSGARYKHLRDYYLSGAGD